MKIAALALLLATLVPPAGGEWQRLFHTPAERAALDREQEQAHIPSWRRYDGQIHRRGGRILRWVDGQATSQPPPPGVKPGEYWTPEGNSRQEHKGASNDASQ